MEAKGHVLIKKEFTKTTFWPNPSVNFMTGETTNLEKEYKEALAGHLCLVMDVSVDDSSYLVLGESKAVGQFLWQIEKEDTVQFLPIIKKNGIIMPAGLSPIEELAWMAQHFENNQTPQP